MVGWPRRLELIRALFIIVSSSHNTFTMVPLFLVIWCQTNPIYSHSEFHFQYQTVAGMEQNEYIVSLFILIKYKNSYNCFYLLHISIIKFVLIILTFLEALENRQSFNSIGLGLENCWKILVNTIYFQ